jgi:hypothetical protein
VRTIAWKVPVFILLTLAAWLSGDILGAGWNEAFVNDRIFSTSIGVNWATIISSSFDVIFFFACGLLTTAVLGGSRNFWWAVALGAVCAALRLFLTRHFFYYEVSWGRYAWTYGVYAIQPAAA